MQRSLRLPPHPPVPHSVFSQLLDKSSLWCQCWRMTTSFPVSFFWHGVGGSWARHSPTRDSLMLLFLPLWGRQWQRSLEPHRAALTNSSRLNSAQLCSHRFALFARPSIRHAFSVPSGCHDSNSMNFTQLGIYYFCTSTPQMDSNWPGGRPCSALSLAAWDSALKHWDQCCLF